MSEYFFTFSNTGVAATANGYDKLITGQMEIVGQSGTIAAVAEASEIFTMADGSRYQMVSSAAGTNNKAFYFTAKIQLADGTVVQTGNGVLNYQIFTIKQIDATGATIGSNLQIMTFPPASPDAVRNFQVTSPTGTVSTINTSINALIAQHGGIMKTDTGNTVPGGVAANWLIGNDGLVPCFVSGTMIKTDAGLKSVEQLQRGDLVMTKDSGLQPVRWVGMRTVTIAQSDNAERFLPVCIKAGALGEGVPERDLYVSQQHRILVKSKIVQRMFGTDEVLVAAKKLLGVEGVDLVSDCDEVTYVHFLFDQHEIVYSNGAETESLYTGPEALKAVSEEAREEILSLFPELSDLDYRAPLARIVPAGRLAAKMAERHVANGRRLFA